ncbi:Pyruvate/Phosphoenolpyruvate kinase-like domain-containing protein [Chaetomium fimeti]|uniref:Pyruvate/Phosphoenolpyruvate kinase-like domain-containing protein n=1 Tax=Chaetomium fimeti TaxID=1854472 RepID=A0AAE0HH66_9PEZI|nr:Pyruvate/Phosphoenolpyruvate kinase-like domain-containing protein [Chaetomium fimeti]
MRSEELDVASRLLHNAIIDIKPKPAHSLAISDVSHLSQHCNNTLSTTFLTQQTPTFIMSDKPFPQQPQLHTTAEFRAAVLTYPGNFREAIRQAGEDPKKTLLGVAQGIPSVFLTKVMASAKPDFIWMDVEHAVFDRSTLYDCIHAAQHHSEGKTMVVCRIPKHDEISLTTALDAGAAGLVIPHTETAQDIRDKVKDAFYPPIGQRSFSPWTFTPGISNQSLYANDEWNMKNSNNHICIIAQIESVKGLENIEEIAAMPEVDALMFGPGDFSADAGINFTLSAPPPQEFLDAMGKFVATAHKYNKPLFGAAQGPAMIPILLQQGYKALAVAFDVWGVANMVKDGMNEARAVIEKDVDAQAAKAAEGTVEVANGNGKAPSS